MSVVKALFHIVISTKHREKTIEEANKRELYAYILGIVKNKGCHLIRINGIANHIHLLVDLAPEIGLSQFIRDLKRSTSFWLKSKPELFPKFEGWGREYYAFSCSESHRDAVVQYIMNQETHHKVVTFDDEMPTIAGKNGCAYFVLD